MSLTRVVASLLALTLALGVSGCGGEPVPDLTGQRLILAPALLERAGFMLGDVRYDEDSPKPAGTVVDQHPAPGRGASPGTPVELTVAGPALVRVPAVVRGQLSDARIAIDDAGLRMGRITERFDARFAEGTVLEQGVGPGQRIEAETRIDLTVSLGPRTLLVPGVVGRDAEAARSFLRDLGLVVAQHFEHSARPAGEVIGQIPEAREEVPRAERVELTVSMGPEMRVMPDLDGALLAEAKERLEELGLEYTAASTGGAIVLTDDAVVVAQEPLPGKLIPAGVTVMLRTGAKSD